MRYSADIWIEPGVDEAYLETGVASIVRLSGNMGFTSDPDLELKTLPEYSLPKNSRGQVDRTFIDTVPQKDALQLFITASDLGSGDGEPFRSFNFGKSRLGRMILSTYRLQTPDDFGALTLHEGGHTEGLVQPDADNLDRMSGFGGHCVNQCVMQAGNSYQDMLGMVEQAKTSTPFCGDCSGFLSNHPRLPGNPR